MEGFWMKGYRGWMGPCRQRTSHRVWRPSRKRGRWRKCVLLIVFYPRGENWGFLHTSLSNSSTLWSQFPPQSQRHTMIGWERCNSGMATSQTDNEPQLYTASPQRISRVFHFGQKSVLPFGGLNVCILCLGSWQNKHLGWMPQYLKKSTW